MRRLSDDIFPSGLAPQRAVRPQFLFACRIADRGAIESPSSNGEKLGWFAVMLVMWWSGLAGAAEYYLEGPAFGERAEAAELVRAAAENNIRGRVVRRFHHGLGWEYIVLFEGFDDRVRATEAAQVVARVSGRGLALYAVDGGDAERLGMVEHGDPSTAAPVAEDPMLSVTSSEIRVDEILERAMRAHGGVDAGVSALAGANSVAFRFTRMLPDGGKVRHNYARRNDDLFLEVEIIEGSGISSRAQVVGDRAWLTTDTTHIGDVVRMREQLQRFSPEHVLAFSLLIPKALQERPELQLLHNTGISVVDGLPCHLLKYDGDQVSETLTLAIDTERSLIRRASLLGTGGLVVYHFRDYREAEPNLSIPFSVTVERDGELIDEIRVSELDLTPRLPEEWFEGPGI